MGEHPIQGLMKTAMESIRDMVDVNTIIGDPIETPDGSVILPVSKVGFGFAAGGTEFESYREDTRQQDRQGRGQHGQNGQHGQSEQNGSGEQNFPFGGGSGGGISITPVAFLVVNKDGVRTVSLREESHLYERLLDMAPAAFDKIQDMFSSCRTNEKKHRCHKNEDKEGNHVINEFVKE